MADRPMDTLSEAAGQFGREPPLAMEHKLRSDLGLQALRCEDLFTGRPLSPTDQSYCHPAVFLMTSAW